jgi:hypothetical protein
MNRFATAAALVLLVTPLAVADRGEIEAVLAEMERAVLAGDPRAYLDLVVPADGPEGDPVFRKEQENWAADLTSEHGGPPAEFDLRIAENSEGEFWPLRAEVELVMTWRMKPADGAGRAARERSVSFPAVFKNVDGRWLYAGENWIVFKGDGVVVRTAAGFEEAAKTVVEVWPEVRTHVEDGFGVGGEGLGVQEVKIYGDMRHLQASIYLSYVDGLAGWNEPGESIKFLGPVAGSRRRGSGSEVDADGEDGDGRGGGRASRDIAAVRTLLAHEYGHVATYVMGEHANTMPWWVLEGVAELASEKFNPRLGPATDGVVRRWAEAGALAPWEEISDFRTVPGRYARHVYRQGHHMVAYVSDRFGRDGRNQWLREMATGKTLDEATQAALGMSFEDLDRAWRAELEREAADEEEAGGGE